MSGVARGRCAGDLAAAPGGRPGVGGDAGALPALRDGGGDQWGHEAPSLVPGGQRGGSRPLADVCRNDVT